MAKKKIILIIIIIVANEVERVVVVSTNLNLNNCGVGDTVFIEVFYLNFSSNVNILIIIIMKAF